MASLSCRISPRTSTVIFLDRSPLATAIVTSAMLRTCAVRLLAIRLTLSVRSFQTPLTSRTCAWPPSLPSVPTSRATRVTSDVNTPSCRIIVLTMVADRRNSPWSGRPSTSSRDRLRADRPAPRPRARRVTALVGHSRSSISVLTDALHLAPRAGAAIEPHALPRLALPADHQAHPVELARRCGVRGGNLVEGVRDLPVEPDPVARQAGRRSRRSSWLGAPGAARSSGRATSRALNGHLPRQLRGPAPSRLRLQGLNGQAVFGPMQHIWYRDTAPFGDSR